MSTEVTVVAKPPTALRGTRDFKSAIAAADGRRLFADFLFPEFGPVVSCTGAMSALPSAFHRPLLLALTFTVGACGKTPTGALDRPGTRGHDTGPTDAGAEATRGPDAGGGDAQEQPPGRDAESDDAGAVDATTAEGDGGATTAVCDQATVGTRICDGAHAVQCGDGEGRVIRDCAAQTPAMGCFGAGICAQSGPVQPIPGIPVMPRSEDQFDAVEFDVADEPDSFVVGWHSADAGTVSLFRIHPSDRTYQGIRNVHGRVVVASAVRLAAGGPVGAPHLFVASVEQSDPNAPRRLNVAVFDTPGQLVSNRALGDIAAGIPPAITHAGDGAMIGFARANGQDWSPRVVALGPDGATRGTETVDAIASTRPEAVAVASDWPGHRAKAGGNRQAVAYVVRQQGDNGLAGRVRRFENGAIPIDASSLEVIPPPQIRPGRRRPFATGFPGTHSDILLAAFPVATPQSGGDHRLALIRTTDGGEPVRTGDSLAGLIAGFPGGALSLVGLGGAPERALVLWREVELWLDCPCDIPPPIRVTYTAQVIDARSMTPVGARFPIYDWQTNAPAHDQNFPRALRIVASSRISGQFTAVWYDGTIGYRTFRF